MTTPSPMLDRHQDDDASVIPYGTPETNAIVVETFGEPEIEYASLRKGAALLDLPHRALIRLTGDERNDFLERMLTQKLTGLTPGHSANAFWTSRQGRIEADLRVILREHDTLLELDLLRAARTIETLDTFIIMDDVALQDATPTLHRLAIHGPNAPALLARALDADLPDLAPNTNATIDAIGTTLTIDRNDTTGETGLDLIVVSEHTQTVYDAITRAIDANPDLKAKRIGWAAYNTARIEAGTPLYNIDFGEKSLPAETGVLEDRVNFAKGCYPGQEIVARMRSLGGPKQILVALEFEENQPSTPQPNTGDAITTADEPDKPVGAITSSTRSPMRSNAIACLAQVRAAHAEPGTALAVHTNGITLTARVRESLAAFTPAHADPGP